MASKAAKIVVVCLGCVAVIAGIVLIAEWMLKR